MSNGDPWLLHQGTWKDPGEWEDSDVWQDGPTITERATAFVASSAVVSAASRKRRHSRSLIMLEGNLRPTSNLATWTDRLELYDGETGDGIDLVEELESITLTLRDPYTSTVVLQGDIEDGSVRVINPGIIEWNFSHETMAGLDPKSYEAGCLVKMEQETLQVFLGRISVRKGL